MRLHLVAGDGAEVRDPYEVRVSGWTEERYFEEAPEDGFYEFKDGELIVASPVSIEHQDVVGFLATLLRAFASAKELGKVFAGPAVLRVRRNLDREPDVFFVAAERLTNVSSQYVRAPVDFIIEVLSQGGRIRDLNEKAEEYEAAGVREYWVVDIDSREVVVHRLQGGAFEAQKVARGKLECDAAPGFWVDADWLWRRPMPSEFDCLREIVGA